MNLKSLRTKPFCVFFFLFTFSFFLNNVLAADTTEQLQQYVTNIEQAKAGMTLGQMIQAGGIFIYILVLLSMAAFACAIYNFLTLKEEKLIPKDFADELMQNLEKKKESNAIRMCETRENLMASIVNEGLSKKKRSIVHAREAMENSARREISKLWQNISYLSDIATVAPLVGLLGTVIGMIQAFNVIAFQTAVVKPILLAGGVSKAMVTTAGGLIVAIPALIFYAYFRGRVQIIANIVESYTTDIVKIIEE